MSSMLEMTFVCFPSELDALQPPFWVYYTASWCGPCQKAKPLVESSGARVVFVDVDKADSALTDDIETVPTLKVFANGFRGANVLCITGASNIECFVKEQKGSSK